MQEETPPTTGSQNTPVPELDGQAPQAAAVPAPSADPDAYYNEDASGSEEEVDVSFLDETK